MYFFHYSSQTWSHRALWWMRIRFQKPCKKLIRLSGLVAEAKLKTNNLKGAAVVVSVLAFYSNDPSSNPADAYSFFCKICVWKERKYTKRGRGNKQLKNYLTVILTIWRRQIYLKIFPSFRQWRTVKAATVRSATGGRWASACLRCSTAKRHSTQNHSSRPMGRSWTTRCKNNVWNNFLGHAFFYPNSCCYGSPMIQTLTKAPSRVPPGYPTKLASDLSFNRAICSSLLNKLTRNCQLAIGRLNDFFKLATFLIITFFRNLTRYFNIISNIYHILYYVSNI